MLFSMAGAQQQVHGLSVACLAHLVANALDTNMPHTPPCFQQRGRHHPGWQDPGTPADCGCATRPLAVGVRPQRLRQDEHIQVGLAALQHPVLCANLCTMPLASTCRGKHLL